MNTFLAFIAAFVVCGTSTVMAKAVDTTNAKDTAPAAGSVQGDPEVAVIVNQQMMNMNMGIIESLDKCINRITLINPNNAVDICNELRGLRGGSGNRGYKKMTLNEPEKKLIRQASEECGTHSSVKERRHCFRLFFQDQLDRANTETADARSAKKVKGQR